MKVTIRLHRQHDMDLFSIYRNKSYHIGREMKKCLIAYAKMEPYCPPEFNMDDATTGYVPTSCIIHIDLNPNKPDEAVAIDLLKHIKYGYRCSFIKALFRSALPYLPLLAYSDDSGFITKRLNTVSDINRMQIQAVINQIASAPQVVIQSNVSNQSAEVIAPSVEVPKSIVQPIRQVVEPKEVVQEVETKSVPNATDESDFDAMFAAMDSMGH